MKKKLIITIDGPSGAGKSTVAKMLAKALDYAYIDTGAMYRGVAYAYRAWSVERGAEIKIDMFLDNLPIRFEFDGDARVFLENKDISEGIRSPEISMLASTLSQNIAVRSFLTKKQREAGEKGGVVMEGRDTGSVVFPMADIKFYLDANPDERARRRHLELLAKGPGSDLSQVKEDMTKRDRNDSERDIAPLTIPENAVVIDTAGIDAKGVTDILLAHIKTMEK